MYTFLFPISIPQLFHLMKVRRSLIYRWHTDPLIVHELTHIMYPWLKIWLWSWWTLNNEELILLSVMPLRPSSLKMLISNNVSLKVGGGSSIKICKLLFSSMYTQLMYWSQFPDICSNFPVI